LLGIERIAVASFEEVGQGATQAFLVGGVREGEDGLSGDAGVVGEEALFDLDGVVVKDVSNKGDERLFDCLEGAKGHHYGKMEEKERQRKTLSG
jgi:hypothetical protein